MRPPRTGPAFLATAALAAVAGCAASGGSLHAGTGERGLADKGLRAPDDVTVHPARILPESLGGGHTWGIAPGGGTRAVVAGMRVVSWPDGGITSAVDRLPAAPSAVIEVPERMGSGFLFALGTHLWRADTWLGRARPLLTAPAAISGLQIGLDRMVVRTQAGGLFAIDPRRGTVVGLGPLPATPILGPLAALDAWRAVAIADLRGAVLTLDAGSTWRPLGLPIDAADVVLLEDGIAVGGTDELHQTQWWEVRPDGQVGRLGAAPATGSDAPAAVTAEPSAHTFGTRPLVAAIEDGWPLSDGTALVARDGALGRVRLTDGALVETVPDAFLLKPARCHPVSLARSGEQGAFGFVCGEPRGRSVVYRYVPAVGRLVELRRFEEPREILGFGNGALAARGGCAADAVEAAADDQAFCIMPPDGAWSEMHFRGDDVERARLVVLHDGRVALIRPPRGEDLSTARLTITDGLHATHLPLLLPTLHDDVARALRLGLWMDGFEERSDGVLSGWVDAGASVVGISLALDGKTRLGSYIRAANDVFVSGRWGLGWTASRRGMETLDGGMTWVDVDVPEPIVPLRATRERACGPVGCLAAGWMRVGWGEPEKLPVKELPTMAHGSTRGTPRLELDCLGSGAPTAPKTASPQRRTPAVIVWPQLTVGGRGPMTPGSATAGSPELPPFMGHAAPALTAEESGLAIDVAATLERSLRMLPTARVDAWGPKGGDWDQQGRWKVRWLWPFGGWSDARGSAITAAPWTSIESARRALQVASGAASGWMLAGGDDADHALLVARHLGPTVGADVTILETDRAPAPVRRPNGDPFAEVEGASRIGGRWYVATAAAPGELAATVVWALDGGQARELARLPRATPEGHPTVHLARRADTRALGVVIEGQPDAEHGVPLHWVASVDLESGAVGEPEALAPVDLSDRAVSLCTGEDGGWEMDVPYPGNVVLHSSPKWESALQSPLARLRLTRDRACVEHLAGAIDTYAARAPDALTRAATPGKARDVRQLDVSVFSAKMRYAMRCTAR